MMVQGRKAGAGLLCQALVSWCEMMMLLSDDPKQQTAGCAEQRVGLAAGKEKEKQKGKKVMIMPVTCTNVSGGVW